MFLLTLRDLQYRAIRFLIAILGTGLVFSMALIMSGLYTGFQKEPQLTIEAIGAGQWVVKQGVTGAFTSNTTFDAKVADQVLRGGADKADAVLIARSSVETTGEPKDVVLFGYRLSGLGEPTLTSGSQAASSGEIVADRKSDLHVADDVKIQGNRFHVTGLTHNRTLFGGTPLVYMDIGDLQRLVFQNRPVATAVLVKGSIRDVPAGFQAMSTEATWNDALRPLKKPVSAINFVKYLLFLVAASIIGAVVYLSALERVRDFAVMKAVGASSRGLLAGLTTQSVLVALAAAIVAAGIQAAIVPAFPLLVTVPVSAFVQLPLIAVAVGALASLGGLRKAVGVDPALAFSGPGG